MWHGYWTAGDWTWVALVTVLSWGLIVTVIVWLAGRGTNRDRPDHSGSGRQTPRELLDERYARGELSDEEYEHRRELLGSR